jgi:hypothetical protein
MTHKTLSAAISAAHDSDVALTDTQKDQLFGLLAGRTRADTRYRLQRRINLPLALWPNYGIFSRVHFEPDGRVSYCAGQDYPAEISYIRGLIIKG